MNQPSRLRLRGRKSRVGAGPAKRLKQNLKQPGTVKKRLAALFKYPYRAYGYGASYARKLLHVGIVETAIGAMGRVVTRTQLLCRIPQAMCVLRRTHKRGTHLAREFVRGAGANVIPANKAMWKRSSRDTLIVGLVCLMLPFTVKVYASMTATVGAAALVGVSAVSLLAAGAHRVVNKGLPAAPNQSRPAQAWGNTARKTLAAAAAFAIACPAADIVSHQIGPAINKMMQTQAVPQQNRRKFDNRASAPLPVRKAPAAVPV